MQLEVVAEECLVRIITCTLFFFIQIIWLLTSIFFPFLPSAIGVLEANFVEPAHDKQDFERTIVLSRLEAKLIGAQKDYWFVLHITCVEIT